MAYLLKSSLNLKRFSKEGWSCLVRLLVGLSCLLCMAWAHAYNSQGTDSGFVVKEYLRDPTRALGLEDVQKSQGWQRFRGNLAMGFTDDAVWVRAVPLNMSGVPEAVAVRIGSPYLDDVQLYRPDDQGQYTRKRVGDKQAFSEREIAANNFVFLWLLSSTTQQQWPIYARISSTSSMLITFELLDKHDFSRMWEAELLLFGFVSGSILLLAILALIHGLIFKDHVSLVFALYQLSSFGMTIGITGIASIFIFTSSNQAHIFTSYAVFLNVLVGLWFYRLLLQEMYVGRWSNPFTMAGGCFCLIAGSLFFSGYERLGLQLNIHLVILILLTMIPSFLWGLQQSFSRLTWPRRVSR